MRHLVTCECGWTTSGERSALVRAVVDHSASHHGGVAPTADEILAVATPVRDGAADADVAAILAHRYDNGADFWATPDGRVYVGNPFSTISSLGMLHELGVPPDHEAVRGGVDLLLDACRDDGRVRVAPNAPLYPCYTAEAVRTLCRFGLARHLFVERTMRYLLDDAHGTGGWRCSFTRFGRGPETRYANPGATIYALDALRFVDAHRDGVETVDRAVESLLAHWDSRQPQGPCHWGIGSRFLQIEYPFLRYNLFFYTYVLSFYPQARSDPRFGEALAVLEGKLDAQSRVVVERPHRDLKGLAFCARGRPSTPATYRYEQIRDNVAGGDAAAGGPRHVLGRGGAGTRRSPRRPAR